MEGVVVNKVVEGLKRMDGKKRSLSSASTDSYDSEESSYATDGSEGSFSGAKRLRKTSSAASYGSLNSVSVGKCPPRDMKRMKIGEPYEITRVARWGEKLALFMKNVNNENDHGFFKPPNGYNRAKFHAGDHVILISVGYSVSRNRIAQRITVKPTEHSHCRDGCTQEYGPEGGCCTDSVMAPIMEKEEQQRKEQEIKNSSMMAATYPSTLPTTDLSALLGFGSAAALANLLLPQQSQASNLITSLLQQSLLGSNGAAGLNMNAANATTASGIPMCSQSNNNLLTMFHNAKQQRQQHMAAMNQNFGAPILSTPQSFRNLAPPPSNNNAVKLDSMSQPDQHPIKSPLDWLSQLATSNQHHVK